MKTHLKIFPKSKKNSCYENDEYAILSKLNRKRIKRKKINSVIAQAVIKLSNSGKKSLITIECHKNLDLKIKEEIIVNQEITVDNIIDIFNEKNPNNDSPMIIKNSFIKATGVIYNSRDSIKDKNYFLKTAIYLSEVSDAVSILTDGNKINVFYKGNSIILNNNKEIEHFLNKNTKIKFKKFDNVVHDNIVSIADSLETLSEHKNGAFITIESHLSLSNYTKEASELDVLLSKETLVHLFNPNNNYSRGGVIVKGNRISFANVYYSVEQVPKFTDESRISSAKFLNKKSDSLSFLVSEKTSSISLVGFDSVKLIHSKKEIYQILNKGYKYIPSIKRIEFSTLRKNEFADTLIELSSLRRGAILSLTRRDLLSEYISSAISLDTTFTKEKLLNIFINYTPLHDGAVIIRGNIIICAGAYFPLGDFKNIDKTTGSRHRAAIGISKKTDALTFVVSEETGIISATVENNIERFLSKEKIISYMEKYLRGNNK